MNSYCSHTFHVLVLNALANILLGAAWMIQIHGTDSADTAIAVLLLAYAFVLMLVALIWAIRGPRPPRSCAHR